MELRNPTAFIFLLLAAVILQRLLELFIAKRNTKLLMANGAVEFGRKHYWMLVAMHSLFFLSIFAELAHRGAVWSPAWPALLGLFLLAQAGRAWVIRSMAGRWTTRIIVTKNEVLVEKGPFAYISHPNYLVVSVEILVLPLLFQLYWTAILFSLFNAVLLLLVRIPEEERALAWTKP